LTVSAGHLRGYGEEEFVDAAVRHESAEQGRAAFMQKERYAEFSAEKFENGSRRNDRTLERSNLR
jgi:Arc/MetJ family transcription regulator